MASWQARGISFLLRQTFKRRLAGARSPAEARAVLNTSVFAMPRGVAVRTVRLGGVPAERLEAGGKGPVLLYLHGGGYFACSAKGHRAYTTYFARQGFVVFAPDYRLAPEHPFPAGLDDVVAAYRALRAEAGPETPIVMGGDSAGGGLALAAMLRLREEGDALPAGAVLFSPLTDLAGTGESRKANDAKCAMFTAAGLRYVAEYYIPGGDPRNPLASPLYGDLRGLPPLLIHVGADETLLDDSRQFAERAREAGVRVELKVWPGVPHVWQLAHQVMPEGRESLNEAARFLRRAAERLDAEVLIAGSGFAGLCMALRLREAGEESFLILERGEDVGGTWRVNTYPGCACDIPSHLYSFSFEPNTEWTRMYPAQPEIWEYIQRVVEKHGLRRWIRFGAEVREAVFHEDANVWSVTTAAGETLRARVVVGAMGPLSRPAYPNLPGLERFEGRAFHSAEWDHACDLRGKRVGVIGTGASAIQLVPRIAPVVERLYLYQRTPPWVAPKWDRPLRGAERWAFRNVPGARRLFRGLLFWRQELLSLGFVVNPKYMDPVKKLALRHIRAGIRSEELRKKVTPDYMPGCKRLLIANDYYPALERRNVELVTERIAEVRARSVVTEDGRERPADALIFATGFRPTDLLTPLRILGRGGVDLNDAWRDGLEAHYGITVSGFPNLFLLVGPNTGLGHNSILFMIEAQVRYVMSCLSLMRERGAAALEVLPEAQARFNRELQERMKKTVWMSGCKSWYQDSRGKNTTLWPGFTWEYWLKTRRVRESEYRLSS